MKSFYDYKKFFVLYVDDEEKSLKYFQETFGEEFSILTATNAREGFKLLNENQDKTAILITDQRMPGEKGVQLLEKARLLHPRVLRILVTAYSDLETAIESVNTGSVYRYVTKPWDIPQMEITLKRGMEFFILQRERDQLLREKMSTLYNVMVTDRVLSLGLLASGVGRRYLNSQNAVKAFVDLIPKRLPEENFNLEGMRNPDFWGEYHQKVQKQMEKMVRMLGDLGNPAQDLRALFPDAVSLHEVVKDALEGENTLLEQKGIRWKNEVPAELPQMRVEREKFSRLFGFLVRYAAAALPPGGKVTIGAQTAGPKGDSLEVQMAAEGKGAELFQDALGSIFDPFFAESGPSQDSGIYLMAGFFIAYHHGGKISARAANGKGNLLTLTFPMDPPAGQAPKEGDLLSQMLVNESMWEKILLEN